ncbi:MAG: hypothetical protein AB7K09_03905 [Planctomycetota bacterium]
MKDGWPVNATSRLMMPAPRALLARVVVVAWIAGGVLIACDNDPRGAGKIPRSHAGSAGAPAPTPTPADGNATDSTRLATGSQLVALRGLIGNWELASFSPAEPSSHPLVMAGVAIEYQSLVLHEDGAAEAETWFAMSDGRDCALGLEDIGALCLPFAAKRMVRDTLGTRLMSSGTWVATLNENELELHLSWHPATSNSRSTLAAVLVPAPRGTNRNELRLAGNPVIAGAGYTELARYD